MTIKNRIVACQQSQDKSHKKVLEKFVSFLRTIYDDNKIGKIIINKGPVHNFIKIKLNFSVSGKLKINVVEYIQNIINNFKKLEYILPKLVNITIADHLFKINPECPKLNQKNKKFYMFTVFFCIKETGPKFKL